MDNQIDVYEPVYFKGFGQIHEFVGYLDPDLAAELYIVIEDILKQRARAVGGVRFSIKMDNDHRGIIGGPLKEYHFNVRLSLQKADGEERHPVYWFVIDSKERIIVNNTKNILRPN